MNTGDVLCNGPFVGPLLGKVQCGGLIPSFALWALDLETGSALLNQVIASGHHGIGHWICYHESICRCKIYENISLQCFLFCIKYENTG